MDSDYATFWVEVTEDLSSDCTIYVYYGKSDALTTSNGASTFPLLFQNFENQTTGENPSRWIGNVSSYTVQSDQAWDGTKSLRARSLPIHPGVTDKQIDFIAQTLLNPL